MLSTENPPPDLYEISQLKSGDVGSDERASDINNKQQLAVDLLKSGLDYNNPVPKFSIRDYVFQTRGKDIKNNWPFSQKNLLVCLKHGVKNVLPHFQSLGSVRNPSIQKRVVDRLCYSDHVKHHELSDDSVCLRPAVNNDYINSSESEEDKEFPSTTTSQSCSDMNAVPPIINSFLEPEAQYLLRGRAKLAVRDCKKARSNTRSPAKKCRLILKLDNIAEPKSAVVSEAMTSKVCPVCKKFSSSSNTTLNAHIDQCLSGESVKLTANSKVIKHRIKPRKTRLMVDIYGTALHSTLEDLDKRNGTNWASNMGLHSPDLLACAKEGKNINQEGEVYIDSSGTKLRILSKSNVNDAGPCKFVKREKVIKLLSSKKKKKKHTIQSLKLHKSCYPRVEVDDVRQKVYRPEGHKEDIPNKSPIPSDHMKSDGFGMIKQWVGSKRTVPKKKINLELENQLPDKSLKSSRTKSASSFDYRGSSGPISPTSSDDNPVLPPEGLQLLSQRKELGSSLLRSGHLSDKKSHLVSSRFNVQRSRKDSISFHKRLMDPPNSAENRASSCSSKKMGISISHHRTFSSKGKNGSILKKLSLGHASSSGGRKFSSLRSKLLSVRHTSGVQLNKNSGRELLNSKSPMRRYLLLSDEEAEVSQSPLHAEDNLIEAMEKDSGELLTNRSGVLKTRKNIGGLVKTDKRGMTSTCSETSTESDTFNSGSVPVGTSVSEEEAEMLDDFVLDPTSTAFSAGSNVECVSQYYSKAYDTHYPAALVFHADHEMLRDSHGMAEMDGDGQGNYFVDVEPIPIPGPPGSFLPSPGRMGSEELPGHSLLTTCRIQSSDDGLEVVDMDSSDSPVSAISTMSNSVAGRSSSVSRANLSAQSYFRHESQLDTMKERINLVVEGSPHFKQIASGGRELNIQSCCCSRKDASWQGGSLSYQEPQILRRRTRLSLPDLALQKQASDDTDFGAADKEPTPVTMKHQTDSPTPHGSEAMLPSPSASNSVLRLMGKNLMVVNKDDNLSPTTRPSPIEHPALSTRNNPNEANSFHRMFNSTQPRIPAQQFGSNSSDAFKIPTNHRPSSPLPSPPSPAMFSGMSFGGNVSYAGGFSSITDQQVSNMETVTIDDRAEREAASGVKATHCSTNMEARESVAAMTLPPDSRHASLGSLDLQVNGFASQKALMHHYIQVLRCRRHQSTSGPCILLHERPGDSEYK